MIRDGPRCMLSAQHCVVTIPHESGTCIWPPAQWAETALSAVGGKRHVQDEAPFTELFAANVG
jgi:hypothetical protein